MKKILLLSIVVLTGIGCGDGVPRGVLPKAKMIDVLWDVMEGGEFVNGYLSPQNPSLDRVVLSNKVLDVILKQHQVSRKEFDKSVIFYQENPGKLKVVLDSINNRQTRFMQEEQDKEAKERARADSIERAKPDSLRRRDSLVAKDSLRRVDSLRHKDSIHVADSLKKLGIKKDTIKVSGALNKKKRKIRNARLRAAPVVRPM
ncbi:MAG: DUF4296 domain-containing protein [Niabella sp.]